MKGIDVSMHNGNIDYAQVKQDGVEVVIIKATEGVNYVDPCLERNYSNAKVNGFKVGFYHFMSEKTEANIQAEEFYNAIKDKECNIIPILDIETNKMRRSSKEITDRCLEFLNKFKQLSGIDCGIYTGGYFARDLLDNRIKSYKVWIAHYGVVQPMYTGFKNVIGHQYTENGQVLGIEGNVDINNFNEGIFFNKTITENNNLIAQLQRECNVQGFSNQVVDGIAGQNTLAGCPTLREGAVGNITKIVQTILGISNDGIFGEQTKNAIIEFQKKNGLVQDGVVGKNTWSKLLKFKAN